MAEYNDLGTIIGQMKRAAIDCWMSDQGFYPAWGNEETYCKWHWAPYQYFRPGTDGSGGGEGVGYDVSCSADFDQIRAAIDGLVAKWLDLPDGSGCETPGTNARSAASILGSNGAGSSVQNSGGIGTSNATVNDIVLGNMKGAFRSPFLMKYYTKFAGIQSGLGQATVILQANYAAEGAMWPAVKVDVATICDSARAAWATQAGLASDANTTLQLTVAGAVVGAVAAVVTAPASLTAAVVGLSATAAGITTALAAVDADSKVDVEGASYSGILSSLQEALQKLDDSITAQETALNKALNEATSTMRGDLGSYDLDAVVLGEFPRTDGSMEMDRTDAAIVSDNMQLVVDDLGQALAAIGSAPASSPTPRGSGIGVSSTGTHAAASELHNLTRRCLELTTSEYGRGRGLFDATVNDFFHTDAAAQRTLRNLLSDESLTSELGA